MYRPRKVLPLRIFIGYDSKEPIAYHVLAHSILRRTTIPVTIAPVALGHLGGIYTRERGPLESTEFSLSRFLVPYLSGYRGFSVFMDCDMLCQVDIGQLLVEIMRNRGKGLWVCQHEYVPKSDRKFLDQIQTAYPRKNWSSFMVFNNEACQALTPRYVNTATGLELHRFAWLPDEKLGSLPLAWNWLVGEYDVNPGAYVLHYTLGGPWFEATRDCDHAKEWLAELEHMNG